ncbi:cytochrome P450 4C1-like [Aphis craccivora]|uniref:Cytochrome P450 4C1-like n=1 Tax=Aphis craccivora TaxID=307492 RepID=A0A6G0Y589_APHCR|nr:cytochrome P450 4C1-like [Aphis craccivora]
MKRQSLLLVFIILILIFTTCFCARRPKEHYRLCAKLPSMQRGYLTDLKFSLQLSTLKSKVLFTGFLKKHGTAIYDRIYESFVINDY